MRARYRKGRVFAKGFLNAFLPLKEVLDEGLLGLCTGPGLGETDLAMEIANYKSP